MAWRNVECRRRGAPHAHGAACTLHMCSVKDGEGRGQRFPMVCIGYRLYRGRAHGQCGMCERCPRARCNARRVENESAEGRSQDPAQPNGRRKSFVR